MRVIHDKCLSPMDRPDEPGDDAKWRNSVNCLSGKPPMPAIRIVMPNGTTTARIYNTIGNNALKKNGGIR